MLVKRLFLEILICFLIADLAYATVDYFESKWSINCLHLFFDNTPPILLPDDDRLGTYNKCLCENYRGIYYVASYYDILKRVPHFSAYKIPRIQENWEPPNKKRNWRKGKGLQKFQQPTTKDYIGIGTESLNRGHLAPRFYFPTKNGRRATDVLTNIALQYSKFNQLTWNRLEQSTFRASKYRCKGDSYFITGVIPNITAFYPSKYSQTKINIPSYFWTAACCDTSNLINYSERFDGWSFAYIAENVNHEINNFEMFTVKEFLQDERIRRQYFFAKLFDAKVVFGYPKGWHYVENCLFNSNKAAEIMNDITNGIKIQPIVKLFHPKLNLHGPSEDYRVFGGNWQYISLSPKFRRSLKDD